MENMRWILLLVGVLLVAGIYIAGRLQSRTPGSPRLRRRMRRRVPEHDLGADDLEALEPMHAGDGAPATATRIRKSPEPAAPVSDGTVFSLFVTAPASVPFRGPVLLGALADAHLEFGAMQIFHRSEDIDGQEQIQFSVANIREPGTFDLSALEDFTTEGLALFMQVPAAADAGRAFDAMVESAFILANALDGQVCDARRCALTQQSIRHMREEVINCQLQQRVAQTAS